MSAVSFVRKKPSRHGWNFKGIWRDLRHFSYEKVPLPCSKNPREKPIVEKK